VGGSLDDLCTTFLHLVEISQNQNAALHRGSEKKFADSIFWGNFQNCTVVDLLVFCAYNVFQYKREALMAWHQPEFVDGYDDCTLFVGISDELSLSRKQCELLMAELEEDYTKNEANRRKKAYKKFYRWFDHLSYISSTYTGFELNFSVLSEDLVPKSKRKTQASIDEYLESLREEINDSIYCSTLVSNLCTISGESMWEWIKEASVDDYPDIIDTYISLCTDCGYEACTSDIISLFDDKLSVDDIEMLLNFKILSGAVVVDHVKDKQTWEFPNGSS
jgi:hypothetical protein